jgi:hypothetical protein
VLVRTIEIARILPEFGQNPAIFSVFSPEFLKLGGILGKGTTKK